ncbi:hypothetical protein [Neorhizobium petrolearium]|uniref:hypothetical protein n=1 Tax=Neorhizobium petrolearium TaxID=515361 RepID=UPI003F820179
MQEAAGNVGAEAASFLDVKLVELIGCTRMKSPAPVVVVDYCRVPDKYGFLQELASALVPRPLIILDGLRGRADETIPKVQRTPFIIKTPNEIYRHTFRSRWFSFLSRASALDGHDLDDLGDRLVRLRAENELNPHHKHARQSVVISFQFTLRAIQRYRPALMLVWNQFHPLSRVAQIAATKQSTRVAFIEYGLLPGTLNFDLSGQMGESDVVQFGNEFSSLPLDARDIRIAEDILVRLRSGEANRRLQAPLGEVERELRSRAKGRPIVLFAGHNDHASGTIPYNDRARKFHSPIFSNSQDAANYLAQLAKESNWFLLYKPHPFASKAQSLEDDDNVMVLGNFDINACVDLVDCVVTILSQVSYVALTRKKPLVMLGYNQLRGSGCHYQAEELSDILPLIQSAIEDGFIPSQQLAWSSHVARLLRYYLYSFPGNAPSIPLARSSTQLAEAIEGTIGMRRAALSLFSA